MVYSLYHRYSTSKKPPWDCLNNFFKSSYGYGEEKNTAMLTIKKGLKHLKPRIMQSGFPLGGNWARINHGEKHPY